MQINKQDNFVYRERSNKKHLSIYKKVFQSICKKSFKFNFHFKYFYIDLCYIAYILKLTFSFLIWKSVNKRMSLYLYVKPNRIIYRQSLIVESFAIGKKVTISILDYYQNRPKKLQFMILSLSALSYKCNQRFSGKYSNFSTNQHDHSLNKMHCRSVLYLSL